VADDATVDVKVFAIEMVYVPQGAFYAGDNATSTASFKQGSSDNDPWYIQNSDAISVTNAEADGFYYVSNSNAGENATGSEFTIPAEFPNGFDALYCMKYEISQGQYVDFLNTLTGTQDATRYMTETGYRHGTWGGSQGSRTSYRSDRACNYLSWMDGAAYADWAGLRPMTELEFEKACRGTGAQPTDYEYAWGNQTITAAVTISGTEDGTETITTSGANCCCNNQTFTGGDAGPGPLRCGIFATASSTRQESGASYYGVMEMSGNVWEQPVTLGNATGRAFTGTNGNGAIDASGNADAANWPSTDAVGAGFRGGDWCYGEYHDHVSARYYAAYSDMTYRSRHYGFRAVRTQ